MQEECIDLYNCEIDESDDDENYKEYIIAYNKYKLYLQKNYKYNICKFQYKKCYIKECKELGCYNFYNKYTNHLCKIHKINGMLKFGARRCYNEICFKYPTFNISTEKKGKYCYEHRLLNMVNVVSKRCKTHMCDIIVSNKYLGYCFYCFSNIYPEKCINYKTKEQRVIDYVQINFTNLTWIHNKMIQDGCSKKRPDLLVDLGYQLIIIEIDENQHIGYQEICENKRIMQLSLDLNHRPIIFIHFNPDEYLKDGYKVDSCWTKTKYKGLIKIKNENEWNHRLNTLKNEINFWINPENKIDKMIHIVQLFFDI